MDKQAPIAIGMNARLFPNSWRPAREEIAFAQAQGFACIQLPGPEQGLDAERLGDPLDRVAALLRQSGVGAVMEMVVRIDADGRTAAGTTPLDVLRANWPAISALGCNPVHWHLVPLAPLSAAQNAALESALLPQIAEAAALAGAQGVRFGIEHNAPAIPLFATAAACAAALERSADLGLVWDINHTTPAARSAFLALVPRMSMLHISDTPLPATNHHLPLGRGAIDLADTVQQLHARGFRGRAILEIGGLPHSGGFGQDTDAALIDSRARLLAAISALGTTHASKDRV